MNYLPAKITLPDVNLWVALVTAHHQHHAAAKNWFLSQPAQSVSFCRVTQMSFLRLLTNRSTQGSYVQTIEQAWEIYYDLRANPRVVISGEPYDIEQYWSYLTKLPGIGPSAWTDAYLAAFAKSHDFELVTFDRGFARWPDLRLTILAAS